ncbi:MAG: hypothetical protein RR386_08835, partial [Bacteroidaceae bacterium]
MRNTEEIKKEMTDAFMSHPAIIDAFELDPAKSFESQFSKAGVINTLFYVVSMVIYSLESIFSIFKSEMDEQIAELKPHSLRWYRNKTLNFMYGEPLVSESDYYNCEQLNSDAIIQKRVVKYCAVTEAKDASILYIKIAGEKMGNREPLSLEQESALVEY